MPAFPDDDDFRPYEPSPEWDYAARRYLDVLTRPLQRDERLHRDFGEVDNGEVYLNGGISLDAATRLGATSEILGYRPIALVERAIATQWYIDRNLSAGLQVVLHGRGRFRRYVQFPTSPPRLRYPR
jgi:hypothetical protein